MEDIYHAGRPMIVAPHVRGYGGRRGVVSYVAGRHIYVFLEGDHSVTRGFTEDELMFQPPSEPEPLPIRLGSTGIDPSGRKYTLSGIVEAPDGLYCSFALEDS